MALSSKRILVLILVVVFCAGSVSGFRYMSFVAGGGNNNVRNSFYGALQVVWLARLKANIHATVVSHPHGGGASADMIKVFNLPFMAQNGLPVIPIAQMPAEDAALAQRDFNDGRCHFSSQVPAVWLQKFEEFKNGGYCQHGVRYTHHWEDSAGLHDVEWQPYNISGFYRATRLRDSIYELADALRSQLPTNYVAVHYRAGDKSPMPLLNCSKHGFSRAGLRSRACTHKHDYLRALVSYEEVMLDIWRVKAPRTVFVATHSFEDDRYKVFRETLVNAGLTVITLPELREKVKPELLASLVEKNKDVGYLTSWVDQLLCTYADEFLPAATSTWTQLVVVMRRELDKKDANEWVQLYAETSRLYGADATHYQYYDGGEGSQIIPNFVTRCPTGTAVAAKYCLCNNAKSNCIVNPGLPAPEPGKGCLGDRRFSPLTFRRVHGFHASCVACRCDPFDGFE